MEHQLLVAIPAIRPLRVMVLKPRRRIRSKITARSLHSSMGRRRSLMDSQACLTDSHSKAMAERLGVLLLATDSSRHRINRAREEATVLRRHLRATEIFGYCVASLYACVYYSAWAILRGFFSDVQMQKEGERSWRPPVCDYQPMSIMCAV